jgi:sulfate adenylyltransferase subunit 1 (EFTu-like GTPase family)
VGVEHVFVGASDSPCAVLMIDSRRQLSEQGPARA